ncbi:extragenic suppressor of kinetochore protein 1 [Sporormia fimetaria CBS 119925]|uniref:Extragenic suppressor of kinetochore protein 1 n=1 Tax=Sporormia fimetaria CBS 119925 TaxID=1340428 RepID=A0A6A6VKH6_9PLEO|nr:extragenic suppressor of kinetochore protein 1 [Sporormia fimetaria CBS 119925]
MFWRFGGYAQISSLDTILDKPDVTVEELLDESDLIQELKQQNSKLVEYLRDDKILDRLLRYVIAPKPTSSPEDETSPSEEKGKRRSGSRDGFFSLGRTRSSSTAKSEAGDGEESKEEKQRMKYAYVSCEILSSEVWSISEALMDNQEYLRQFWDYIKQPAPLDPVQAGYFTKVNESLLDRKMEEMLEFFKSLDNVVPNLLQHVDCPMIMDLLLKIISLEKSEGGQGIVDWLQTQDLIPRLLSNLSADHTSSTQTSAGDFIKAIITISANATTQDQSVIGPNELTRQLVSEPCIKSLIEDMLRGGNPLTVGVGIIIEVIRKNNSDYDLENQVGPVPKNTDPIYLGTLLRQFAEHIPQFMELVHNPNQTVVNKDGSLATRRRELKTAFGEKIEPLGFDRFKTCELMAELLHCSNMALLNERGSEAEVKRRDAERERLKAEGKLKAKNESAIGDISTSVDSHGFHHARAPSSEAPEVVKRLEVQNNSEDDFEKVNASEVTSEDSKESEQASKETPATIKEEQSEHSSGDGEFVDESLSPAKESSPGAPTPAKVADDAESPTSAGLSSQVGGLDLDQDTVMSDRPDHPPAKADDPAAKEMPSLLTQQLNQGAQASGDSIAPRPEDTPAPLFSGKRDSASDDTKEKTRDASRFTAGPSQAEESEVTPIDDNSSTRSVLLAQNEGQYSHQYEVDIDGTPVVGDLLKMKFVENKVVPTILDFFFRFPWNNFLHNVVYDVVQQVFNGLMDRGYNRALAIDLFETGRITDRIIEGQQASDKAQAETNMRLGYMGHLTLIAEEVLKFTERHPAELLSQSVLDKVMSPTWIDYVEQTLAETRERDNAILGGVRPDMSVGPRQAVLNAVNAGSGFADSSLSSGLGGSSTVGLDTMELSNADNGGYIFNSGTLLSGFTNSSDEEDEEMEEGDEGQQRERVAPVSDTEQVGELSFEDVEMEYR